MQDRAYVLSENEEKGVRENLLRDISSSYIWLNIYNNSYVLNSLSNSIQNSAGLSSLGLSELAAIHFLIKCNEYRICDIIEDLLSGIAFSIQRLQTENRAVIRGNIDWGLTIQKRIASGFNDRTLFITKNNARDYDTLPNQLLRFLIQKIITLSNTVTSFHDASKVYDQAWINQVTEQARKAKRIATHSKFLTVNTPAQISFQHIESAASSRIKNYRIAAMCAKVYYDVFISRTVMAMKELIMQRVLVPVDTSVVYEFAVLFKTLSYFDSQMKNNDTRKYVLLRASEQTVFEYHLAGNVFKIYYQSLPKNVTSKAYSSCLKAHGYIGSSLRPDIIITCENSTGLETRIIEVKYSLRRAYAYEGMKDVLAYLYDFEDVDHVEDGCILLATYLNTPIERMFQSKVWIAGYDQLEDSISQFIEKMLASILRA